MKGKFTITSVKDNYMEIEFKEVPYYYINAIRRYIIGNIPVYAIDKIIVYENKTSFFDEYIAHRIGMIPLKVDDSLKDEEIAFFLDEQGPKVVYSSSLKSNIEKAKVAVENIPIITLKDGKSIRLEGRVKKSIGREHSKFQSGISSYEVREENGNNISGIMFVETLYHFSPKELLEKALEALSKDISDFGSSLKKALKK